MTNIKESELHDCSVAYLCKNLCITGALGLYVRSYGINRSCLAIVELRNLLT